jgi:hypothetical protein
LDTSQTKNVYDVSDFLFAFVGAIHESPAGQPLVAPMDKKRGRFLDLFLLLKANYLLASSIRLARLCLLSTTTSDKHRDGCAQKCKAQSALDQCSEYIIVSGFFHKYKY